MSLNIRLIPTVLIGAVAAALLVGCQMGPGPQAQLPTFVAKHDTALLTVTGSPQKMLMFDTRLRQLLGAGQQDSDILGCKDCDKLRQGVSTVAQLVYIIPRKSNAHFQSIGTAWDDVWYDSSNQFNAADRLKMQLDYNDTPEPDCSQLPQPCFTRPTCRATGYCSKNSSGLCLACTQ